MSELPEIMFECYIILTNNIITMSDLSCKKQLIFPKYYVFIIFTDVSTKDEKRNK